MAYKFQKGTAVLSGALDQEGSIDILDDGSGELELKHAGTTVIDSSRNLSAVAGTFTAAVSSSNDGRFLALDIGLPSTEVIDSSRNFKNAVNIDGSGDLTMGTITMSGFTVDADGDVALKSLAIDDGSTIGPDSVTDLITLTADGDLTFKDGAFDFDIASHDGTNGLKLAGSLVTSDAGELNLLDGAAAGIVVNSKAVIYSSSGSINIGAGAIKSTGAADFGAVSGTLEFSVDVGANGGLTMSPFNNSANVDNLVLDVSTLNASITGSQLVGSDVLSVHDGAQKKSTIADLAFKLAGGGLTATNGVIATQAGSVAVLTHNSVLSEGYNYATGTLLANVELPFSPTVGDVVYVKAGDLAGGESIRVAAPVGTTVDGIAAQGLNAIQIESPYGAAGFVYLVSGSWGIV